MQSQTEIKISEIQIHNGTAKVKFSTKLCDSVFSTDFEIHVPVTENSSTKDIRDQAKRRAAEKFAVLVKALGHSL